MPTTLQLLNQICESCKPGYDAAFNATPRLSETIIGDLYVEDCCFIRDEIHFTGQSQLIFKPKPSDGKPRYCPTYFVICRKLVISKGSAPGSANPCGADDPGHEYKNNNVITWADRLNGAANGGPPNSPAHTPDGVDGPVGALGKPGGPGASAPGQLVIVALEVDAGPGDHLNIDWNGQTGGKGGKGGRGADGGDGVKGADGVVDSGWPSDSCSTEAQNGGNGGRGGDGGVGGTGGRGGDAGSIYIISTAANVGASGIFLGGDFSYVNSGGFGGDGGAGGLPGAGGHPGRAGRVKGPCQANASDGSFGNPGDPGDDGVAGDRGARGETKFLTVIDHDCTRTIPLPVFVGSIAPTTITRGHATPDSADLAVTGTNLAQVSSITTSLAGVTAAKKPTSTDTQLDLKVDMSGASGTGAANMTFTPDFGNPVTVPNAVTVEAFTVTSVAPNSGAHNTSVNVTINGLAFDPTAAIQTVSVSGAGVNVLNVVVVDSHQIQCVFDIGGATAAVGARNVTVKTGSNTHSLIGGFTVTA
jgi:hypothetical protein